MDNKQIPPSGPLTESDSYSPSAIYFDGTYMDGNQTWHAEDSPWKAKQIARILRRNKLNPASVCEVGCGAGEILVQLSSSFADTTFVGYERSPQAMAMCQSKETPKVSYRMRDIFEDPEVFDCLLCIDVFEHVDDYMGFLRKLRTKSRYKVFHIPLDVSVFSVLNSSMLHARHISPRNPRLASSGTRPQ